MTKENFSQMIKQKISEISLKYLLKKRNLKGKEISYDRLEMADYFMPYNKYLNIEEKQNLFSVRNRIVEIGNNFGNNENCIMCQTKEDMNHIYNCEYLNKQEIKTEFSKIYEGNLFEKIKVLRRFNESIDIPEVVTNGEVEVPPSVRIRHTRQPDPVVPFPCELCGLVFCEFSQLQNHMITHHSTEVKCCQYCQFKAKDGQDLEEHMIDKHADIVILHTMAKQVDEITERYANFEEAISDLRSITKEILAIKQELFVIRNKIISNEQKEKNNVKDLPVPPKPETQEETKNYQQKVKVLMVGDSITNHANMDVIEEATDTIITKVKAYSAIYDDVSNVAKDAAKFPNKNFLQVVPNEATKESFDHLVVQAGSIDITNLKTKDEPENHLEYFRQQTVMSAKNTFDSCLLALEKQPSLKSVVIMKQTPRYDPLTTDPLSIKPALSQLFNNTLTELWVSCPMKHKIHIGTHNIDCTGAVQSARYRHTQTGKFDGVHLYGTSGSKAYTNSVVNIFKAASLTTEEHNYHQSCPQYRYKNRKGTYQGN